MAHHAANHVGGMRDDAWAGTALGARMSAAENRRIIENASGAGAGIGRLAYSQAKEREADRPGQPRVEDAPVAAGRNMDGEVGAGAGEAAAVPTPGAASSGA